VKVLHYLIVPEGFLIVLIYLEAVTYAPSPFKHKQNFYFYVSLLACFYPYRLFPSFID
jgi:hypothetical protein